MPSAAETSDRYRDPAWRRRLTWTLLALVLLWPLLVTTQFKPWQLADPTSLNSTLQFLSTFLPPALQPQFLVEILKAAWVTLAIATAGLALALVLAVPLTLVATSRLSISRLGRNRMAAAPLVVRQAVRALLIVLRSVPELVFALLFVRIVGLGPTAGVLAIALSYAGMLAKVYAEIIESAEGQAAERTAEERRRPAASAAVWRAARLLDRARLVHRVPLGMCNSRLGDHGDGRRRRTRPATRHLDENAGRQRSRDHPGRSSSRLVGAGRPAVGWLRRQLA